MPQEQPASLVLITAVGTEAAAGGLSSATAGRTVADRVPADSPNTGDRDCHAAENFE